MFVLVPWPCKSHGDGAELLRWMLQLSRFASQHWNPVTEPRVFYKGQLSFA